MVLHCLERRALTDAERTLALRIGVAADLETTWPDSARQRLARATGAWATRERELWVLVVRATGVATLGDVTTAADRLSTRLRTAPDTDAVGHWVLAWLGLARVAVAHHDTAAVAHACGSFESPISYIDRVVGPEIGRLCGTTPGG